MNKNKKENISEIRIEEVHDNVDGLYFYRAYFYHTDGRIEIMSESLTKPILARYVSKIY